MSHFSATHHTACRKIWSVFSFHMSKETVTSFRIVDGLLHVLVTRWTFINIRSLGEIVFQQFYTLPVKNEATHESSAYFRHIIHLQFIALDLPQQWCIAAKTLHPTWSCVYVAAGVVTMLAVTTVAVRHANISSSSNTATVIPRKFVH